MLFYSSKIICSLDDNLCESFKLYIKFDTGGVLIEFVFYFYDLVTIYWIFGISELKSFNLFIVILPYRYYL